MVFLYYYIELFNGLKVIVLGFEEYECVMEVVEWLVKLFFVLLFMFMFVLVLLFMFVLFVFIQVLVVLFFLVLFLFFVLVYVLFRFVLDLFGEDGLVFLKNFFLFLSVCIEFYVVYGKQ